MFVYSEEGAHARQAHHQHRQRRILRPRRRRGGAAVVVAHRPRPGLPRRSASASRRPSRPAGPLAGQHALLLRCDGPHLGTASAHQGPPRRRRPGTGHSSFLQAIEPFVYRKYLSLRRDQRNQGDQTAHRAEDQPGRRQRHGGQDRPRRHPRHRVHHPVSATAQRRRPAASAPAQHACSPCPPWSASAV